jgi:hypothetical protein
MFVAQLHASAALAHLIAAALNIGYDVGIVKHREVIVAGKSRTADVRFLLQITLLAQITGLREEGVC